MGHGGRRLIRSGAPWLTAAAGGAIWSACFLREPATWLAWGALVPLLCVATGAATGRRAALLGWLHGTVFWLLAIPWLASTLETFGGLPPWLSHVLLLLLCLYLGMYHAGFAAGTWWLARRRSHAAVMLLGVPALWVVLAWTRGHAAVLAFPWNLAGYAWVDVPGALPLTAWVGSHGLSFFLVLANLGFMLALRRRWAAGALAVMLPLVVLAAAGRWSAAPTESTTAGRAASSAVIVQPNTAMTATTDIDWQGYQRLMSLSASACNAGRTPLLVWPESATFPLDYERSRQLRDDVARLTDAGCAVLLNSPETVAEGPRNSALLVTRDGIAASYAKRRLVPWGEYVPLGEWLPWLHSVARIATPFVPGHGVGLMPWGDEHLGMAICFEVIFPQPVAEQARAGASVLVTITNDAWYGDTAAPWQHFRAARFRAAENRRPLLRAALTGVSGLIDARGRVIGQLDVGEADVLRGDVTGVRALAPYTRAPWAVPLLCLLVCLSIGAFASIPRRRR